MFHRLLLVKQTLLRSGTKLGFQVGINQTASGSRSDAHGQASWCRWRKRKSGRDRLLARDSGNVYGKRAIVNQFNPQAVDSRLRRELNAVNSERPDGDIAWHIPYIEDLRPRYGHTIHLAEKLTDGRRRVGQFNCYMYALGVRTSETVIRILNEQSAWMKFGKEFLTIVRGTLTRVTEPSVGDLVLYSDPTGLQHAGKWNSDSVLSKWGLGHVWRHGVFELPASYGDVVEVYKAIEIETVEAYFQAYANP